MFEAGVTVVQRHAAIESLIKLNGGAGEAEAPLLGRDLRAVACPPHDVVVFEKSRGSDAPEIGHRVRCRKDGSQLSGRRINRKYVNT